MCKHTLAWVITLSFPLPPSLTSQTLPQVTLAPTKVRESPFDLLGSLSWECESMHVFPRSWHFNSFHEIHFQKMCVIGKYSYVIIFDSIYLNSKSHMFATECA